MTRRRVSGMACAVVGVSGVKLDMCEDRARRLRRLTLAVKSLELIKISRHAGMSSDIAHLVLKGTWWDMSLRTEMSGGAAAAVSSSESQLASALLGGVAIGGLEPFMPSCIVAKSSTSGSWNGPCASS